MTPEQLADRVTAFQREDDRHAAAGQLVQERVTSLGDYFDHAGTFFRGAVEYGLNARYFIVGAGSRKKTAVRLTRLESQQFFERCTASLEEQAVWTPEFIEARLRVICEEAKVAVGDGFMAVRVACLGRPTSPPLFESLHVLGRALTLSRLRHASSSLADANFLQRALADVETELAAARAALVSPNPTPEASHA